MITFDDYKDLLVSDRTVRRFRHDRPIPYSQLRNLVELVRYTASGRNAQPLKYYIISTPELCADVYPLLKWAGYYQDWDGPMADERPVAYLVQCLDTRYGDNCLCDDGLQLQAITLGAKTLGIAGCIIKSFNAPALSRILNLSDILKPRYVLALGYPVENVQLEDMSGDSEADFKYYRTVDGVHHVPKRPLSELIISTDDEKCM